LKVTRNKIYVTFGFGAREDWDAIMPPAKIDGRWKQETIDKKMPELNAKRLADAPLHLAGGLVADVGVSIDGKYMEFKDASEFVKWANTLPLVPGFQLIGVNLLHSLRHCGWDCARRKQDCAPWLWNPPYDTGMVLVDLKTMSGAKAEGIDIVKWMGTWGVDWPIDSAGRIASTMALAKKMGV
jgi:hypothetical protein